MEITRPLSSLTGFNPFSTLEHPFETTAPRWAAPAPRCRREAAPEAISILEVSENRLWKCRRASFALKLSCGFRSSVRRAETLPNWRRKSVRRRFWPSARTCPNRLARADLKKRATADENHVGVGGERVFVDDFVHHRRLVAARRHKLPSRTQFFTTMLPLIQGFPPGNACKVTRRAQIASAINPAAQHNRGAGGRGLERVFNVVGVSRVPALAVLPLGATKIASAGIE